MNYKLLLILLILVSCVKNDNLKTRYNNYPLVVIDKHSCKDCIIELTEFLIDYSNPTILFETNNQIEIKLFSSLIANKYGELVEVKDIQGFKNELSDKKKPFIMLNEDYLLTYKELFVNGTSELSTKTQNEINEYYKNE